MKGDRGRTHPPPESPSSHFLTFQRRTIQLDWRRIASLDLDKLVQEGNPHPLEELTTPILYCKAEAEFDRDQVDPGFVKVFRLSQLIGEYLQYLLRQSETSLALHKQRSSRIDSDRKKLTEESRILRDLLTLAKKELRRRSDLLSSVGIDIPPSSLDEYDQCPYCVKRFVVYIYLHAHIQRRHQGLPLPIHSTPSHPLISGISALPTTTVSGGSSVPPLPYSISPYTNLSPAGGAGGTFTRRNSSTQTPGNKTPTPAEPSSNNIPVSGRSEGEVRPEDVYYEAIPPGNPGTSSAITQSGDAAAAELKTSSETVTVIKSPPACWSHNNDRRTPPEEEGEVPPDEESSENIPGHHPRSPSPSRRTPPPPPASRMDIQTICDLIETYLDQKSIPSRNQHYSRILSSIQSSERFPQSSNHSFQKSNPNVSNSSPGIPPPPGSSEVSRDSPDPSTTPTTQADKLLSRTEQVERNVMRMKDEFEAQWQHLSERVRDSGLHHLEGSLLLSEIKKVQDILNSPRPLSRNEGVPEEPPIDTPASSIPTIENPLQLVQEVVEERFQKQQMHLDQLKSTLETKMESELRDMKARLEEQNVLWRQQLLQQSVTIQSTPTDHPKSPGESPGSPHPKIQKETTHQKDNEILPHKTLEMQMTSSEGNPRVTPLDQSIPSLQPKTSHEFNMTHSKPNDESHQQISQSSPPAEPPPPIPKPRKAKSILSTCSDLQEHLVDPSNQNQITFHPVSHDDKPKLPVNHLQEMHNDFPGTNKPSDQQDNEFPRILQSTGTGDDLPRSSRSSTRHSLPSQPFNQTHFYPSESSESDETELSRRNEELESLSSSFTFSEEKARRSRKPGMKYVFDETQGKLVGAWELSQKESAVGPFSHFSPESQLDLVRQRTLHEFDDNLQTIGINPEASTITLEEMARALRHLKTSRPSSEDRDAFKAFRSEVRDSLAHEVTKKSIHQKLGSQAAGGDGSFASGASPLAKMLHRVKKSGTSWKRKVASAIRRKQANSPNQLQDAVKSETQLKTSFFSKSRWVRKDSTKSPKPSHVSPQDTSEDEESSVDIELPPFLTKSKPLLLLQSPPGSPHKMISPPEQQHPGAQQQKPNPTKSQMMNEQVNQTKSKSTNQNFGQPESITHNKCPNFFVNDSNQNNSSTQDGPSSSKKFSRVTSNGWSATQVPQVFKSPPDAELTTSSVQLPLGSSLLKSQAIKHISSESKTPPAQHEPKKQTSTTSSPVKDTLTGSKNKSWKDNLLAELSSSSSSEYSDSEVSSSPQHSSTNDRVNKKTTQDKQTFIRSDTNRLPLRKNHPSTSSSDNVTQDIRIPTAVDSKPKRVRKPSKESNSSDTSIWEDVDDEDNRNNQVEHEQSDSGDLPPPSKNPTHKSTHHHPSPTPPAGDLQRPQMKPLYNSKAGNSGKLRSKSRKKSSSPPTNSWDSS